MLTDDRAAAHVERRCKPAVDTERLAPGGGANDVDDCVDRSHFVEVNGFDGNGMDSSFGLAEKLKGARRARLHRFRERGGANDGEDR